MIFFLLGCLPHPVESAPAASGACSDGAKSLSASLAPIGGGVECEGSACAVWYPITPDNDPRETVSSALSLCVPWGIAKHYISHNSAVAEGSVYGNEPENPRLYALAVAKANALVGLDPDGGGVTP